MSDAAIFTLVFGGLLVLRVIAATLVFLLILPRGDHCPLCDATTVRIQSHCRGSVVPLTKRWCLACGWEGFMRRTSSSDERDSHRSGMPPSNRSSDSPRAPKRRTSTRAGPTLRRSRADAASCPLSVGWLRSNHGGPRERLMEAEFDVLVVGAGHAGTEAAVAAARLGARVGLITSALETIGQMSCNPAIGGVAKSTVVREVDALGGIMARATDLAMLQFRMLNRSKGAAVWAPRAQCDRGLYRRAVRSLIEGQPRLRTIQGTVARLLLDANGATALGVETLEGRRFAARAVVLTAGTFLRGKIHIGTTTNFGGGRAGEAAALDLAEQLERAGIEIARFKTGTPPRIDGRTVDYSVLEAQESEIEQFDYSWSHFWTTPRRSPNGSRHPVQLPCYITYLAHSGKELIEENIAQSAMCGGAITARGPRYCPSVEDKVVKFPHAERHQLFLEPEGHDTSELYVNGLSTSLPAPVQLEILRTVPGLAQVHMTRAGYAIEYDYFPPTQLESTLQVRQLRGLYFAGQINGTTGYEEAAGRDYC